MGARNTSISRSVIEANWACCGNGATISSPMSRSDRCGFTYDTPLHFAAMAGDAEAIANLVLARADVNAKREDKSTPLHIAAEYCNIAAVMSLLSARADVNARNLHGNTSLAVAKWNIKASKDKKAHVIAELG